MNVQIPAKTDLSKYVEVRIFGERPHIRGRRIPVAMIVYSALRRTTSVALCGRLRDSPSNTPWKMLQGVSFGLPPDTFAL